MDRRGEIIVNVYRKNSYIPITDAKVTITSSEENRRQQIVVNTNSVGQTESVDLSAPSIELSLEPQYAERPYSLWDLKVEAEGYAPVIVRNAQVLPDTEAIQNIELEPVETQTRQSLEELIINVLPNKLFGNFPPKIPEAPEKPLPGTPGGGEVVLSQVVVPEFVVIHAGVPNNTGAPNYKVPFKDYIKNVASSEIYDTWPENTIRANIYCILSFTLNRVFTEWYRGKGYNFTITNSTAFDHAFSYGRNIFGKINRIVDEIFTSYIKRQGAKQPLLTQYCDGERVKCPGWLTQWGSKYLGDQGKTPYEILTNFYGTDIDIVKAPKVGGIPKSEPGYVLKVGSRGEPVRSIQIYLNRISNNYPLIPKLAVDGVYGSGTANSVKVFQSIFGLPQTGKVDTATWYKISNIYVGVSKIAELRSSIVSNTGIFTPPVPYSTMENVPTIEYPI